MLVRKKKINYSLLLEDESPTSDLHFISATPRKVETNADSSKQPGQNSPQKVVKKRWKKKLKQNVPLSVNGDEKLLVSPKSQQFCLVEYSKPIESPVFCFDNTEELLSTVKFSESNTSPDQTITSWNRRIIKRKKKQKANCELFGDNEDDDIEDDIFYLRRHTIADMTVAAYGMVICGTDDMHQRYRGRIEKVKFGVPISEAFSHDIPATLLVLLLKVNKEGPLKKDIWRAPGNQAQVRKLSHIMQHGRLVNISNISVYTAASVIKKFLSKLPGGIFGSENEQELFTIVQQPDSDQQRQVFCRVICSLSVPSQHLLVLLFGTFRIISDSADSFGTRMTPDAIGISVAPSLFHTCIHDGQRAKLEDVMRFKLASQVISKIIQGFGFTNLFPRECYEFYARITGRTLRVDEHWHFTFQYPSNSPKRNFSSMISDLTAACAAVARSYSLESLESDKQPIPSTVKNVRRGGSLKAPTTIVRPTKNRHSVPPNQIFSVSVGEESEDEDKPPSTAPPPPPIEEDEFAFEASPETLPRHLNILRAIDDLDLRESASFTGTFSQPTIHRSPSTSKVEEDIEATSSMYKKRRNTADITAGGDKLIGMEPLEREFADQRLSASMGEVLTHSDYEDDERPTMASRCVESLESTRSLSYLEWVHEKQFRRMQTRSEWFLSPVIPARTSKSVDFRENYQPNTLHIPKSLEMVSSSEEMQISPNRVEKHEEITSQQLQESTTTLKQTPVQTPQTTKNLKEIFMLQSGPILPAVVAVSPRVVSSIGVVRKRSWRTHYVRPNKSFDQEELVSVEKSVHSAPRRSSTTTVSRRQSEALDSNTTTPRVDIEKHSESRKNA